MSKTGLFISIAIAAAVIAGCTKSKNPVDSSNSSGMTWTVRTAGIPDSANLQLSTVLWANNKFIVPCYTGNGNAVMLTSTDGKSWTPHNTNLSYLPNAIAGGGNKFAAVSGDTILASNDAMTWSKQTISMPANFSGFQSIVWGGNKFVATGVTQFSDTVYSSQYSWTTYYYDTAYALSSTDGISWTKKMMGPIYDVNNLSFLNNSFITVSGSIRFTSTDGIQWTRDSINMGLLSNYGSSLSTIAYGANQYIGINNNGGLARSSDGVAWSLLPEISAQTILWDGSRFIAAYRSVFTSTDGLNWEIQTPYLPSPIYEMASGNGVIVATNGFSIFTSP